MKIMYTTLSYKNDLRMVQCNATNPMYTDPSLYVITPKPSRLCEPSLRSSPTYREAACRSPEPEEKANEGEEEEDDDDEEEEEEEEEEELPEEPLPGNSFVFFL